MNRSIVFQILNGFLSVTAVCGMFLFLRYLWYKWELGYKELRPAFAILTLWIGEEILRAPVFYQRTLANMGLPSEEPVLGLFLGGFLVEASFLCMIRVFSPEEWGFWSWLGTLLLSIFVVSTSLALVYWR